MTLREMAARGALAAPGALALVVALAFAGAAPVCAAEEASAERDVVELDEVGPAPLLEGVGDGVSASRLMRLESRWWRRHGMLRRGDRLGAGRAALDLREYLDAERVGRVPEMAQAAWREGLAEESTGHLSNALEAYRFAQQLDPRLPAAYAAEARLTWREGSERGRALALGREAIGARWSAPLGLVRDGVNLGAALLLGFAIAGAALVVALLARHGPRLAAAFASRLPLSWNEQLRRALGWTLLLAPLAFPLLGAFALLAWAALLFPALARRERVLVGAWLLVLALAAPAAGSLWELGRLGTSESARAGLAAAEGLPRADLVSGLTRLVNRDPGEATWRVLLARLVADEHPDQALLLLRQAARLDPSDPRIRVALGNILYRVGKPEAAGVLYREAIELDPHDGLALFNLARVRLVQFDFAESESLSRRAADVAPELVARLAREVPDEQVADPRVSVDEVTERLFHTEGPQGASLASPLGYAAIGALVLGLLLTLRLRSPRHESCQWCGAIHDPLDARQPLPEETCRACHQLFSRSEGLAPAARKEQGRRVDRHLSWSTRRRLLGHLLWPGLPLVVEGRTLLGALEATLFALLLTLGLLAPRLFPPESASLLWPPGAPFLVAAGVLWLIVQLPGLRPRAGESRPGRI